VRARSMIRPSRRTTIWSASRTVEVRCESNGGAAVHDARKTREDALLSLRGDAGEGSSRMGSAGRG